MATIEFLIKKGLNKFYMGLPDKDAIGNLKCFQNIKKPKYFREPLWSANFLLRSMLNLFDESEKSSVENRNQSWMNPRDMNAFSKTNIPFEPFRKRCYNITVPKHLDHQTGLFLSDSVCFIMILFLFIVNHLHEYPNGFSSRETNFCSCQWMVARMNLDKRSPSLPESLTVQRNAKKAIIFFFPETTDDYRKPVDCFHERMAN